MKKLILISAFCFRISAFAGVDFVGVFAHTNGALIAPANFFNANASAINTALTGGNLLITATTGPIPDQNNGGVSYTITNQIGVLVYDQGAGFSTGENVGFTNWSGGTYWLTHAGTNYVQLAEQDYVGLSQLALYSANITFAANATLGLYRSNRTDVLFPEANFLLTDTNTMYVHHSTVSGYYGAILGINAQAPSLEFSGTGLTIVNDVGGNSIFEADQVQDIVALGNSSFGSIMISANSVKVNSNLVVVTGSKFIGNLGGGTNLPATGVTGLGNAAFASTNTMHVLLATNAMVATNDSTGRALSSLLAANQSITFSGAATGSGSTAITLSLAAVTTNIFSVLSAANTFTGSNTVSGTNFFVTAPSSSAAVATLGLDVNGRVSTNVAASASIYPQTNIIYWPPISGNNLLTFNNTFFGQYMVAGQSVIWTLSCLPILNTALAGKDATATNIYVYVPLWTTNTAGGSVNWNENLQVWTNGVSGSLGGSYVLKNANVQMIGAYTPSNTTTFVITNPIPYSMLTNLAGDFRLNFYNNGSTNFFLFAPYVVIGK